MHPIPSAMLRATSPLFVAQIGQSGGVSRKTHCQTESKRWLRSILCILHSVVSVCVCVCLHLCVCLLVDKSAPLHARSNFTKPGRIGGGGGSIRRMSKRSSPVFSATWSSEVVSVHVTHTNPKLSCIYTLAAIRGYSYLLYRVNTSGTSLCIKAENEWNTRKVSRSNRDRTNQHKNGNAYIGNVHTRCPVLDFTWKSEYGNICLGFAPRWV